MRNILQPFLAATMFATLPLDGKQHAKEIFHTFVIGVYFFPLLGGWLADRFFGKYNTILWFSLIYCVGQGLLALFVDTVHGFFAGLALIALGSGGIKPLVASFMGDQFDETNKDLAKKVFDAFYWIINFGSFFASLLMPVLLVMFGPRVAFGVPGILMFIATVVFWAGRKRYVLVPRKAHDPDAFIKVVRTALTGGGPGTYIALGGVAIALGAFSLYALDWLEIVPTVCLALVVFLVFGGIGTSMQLDRAREKHSAEAVDGVRAVLSILIVFALVTPFHSLFDQKATTWVIQGGDMRAPTFDLGSWYIALQPAQMQAVNPALVMLLIPFNNFVFYPWLRKKGWEPTALRRMTFGIVFAAVAWIAAGVLQLVIESGPRGGISIFWQLIPYVLLTFGEVLVSATGLEFAYSQAPLAMKGVIMSFWNLTTTVGSLWVLLVGAGLGNTRVQHVIESTGLTQTGFAMFFFAAFAGAAAFGFWRYTQRYRVVDNYRSI
ncbi:oligopeptide:H+ symporter [soil metagenome]